MTEQEMERILNEAFKTVFRRNKMNEMPRGMMTCPECDGHGQIEIDTPITDWNNGHDVMTKWWTCETCFGDGIVEDEDYDEDANE